MRDGVYENLAVCYAQKKDYQKANGLVVDGIVGAKTWEKLNER